MVFTVVLKGYLKGEKNERKALGKVAVKAAF
jgi:hypothetical protein